MATTSPDNIRTPDLSDPYNLVPDLQMMANDVQDALISRTTALEKRANWFIGTSAERAAASVSDGAIWRDTTDNFTYIRVSGGWKIYSTPPGPDQNLPGTLDVPGSVDRFTYAIRAGVVIIAFNTTSVNLGEGNNTIYTPLGAVSHLFPMENQFGSVFFGSGYTGVCFIRPNGTIAIAQRTGAARSNPQGTITYGITY